MIIRRKQFSQSHLKTRLLLHNRRPAARLYSAKALTEPYLPLVILRNFFFTCSRLSGERC